MYRDLLAEQRNTILGIDLGTTHSLVAVATNCSVRVIPSPKSGATKLPSILSVDSQGNFLVGEAAKAERLQKPETTITSIKRFMGKSFEEAQASMEGLAYSLYRDAENQQVAHVKLGDQVLSAPEVSAHYLRELKIWGETELGKNLQKAVITVPAYFNEAQRQATRDAGKIAGLEVLRIINEPTAAALAYGLQEDQKGRIAIYDFGGGTFDVSILHLEDGVFQVQATGGDTQLGGDQIDWEVAQKLFERSPLKASGHLKDQNHQVLSHFLWLAEDLKIKLSEQEEVEFTQTFSSGEVWSASLNSQELEEWAEPVVQDTLAICQEVLESSGLQKAELDHILLVGGSSRMPLVQRKVSEFFGKPARFEIDPEEVVALGAAVQGRILAGGLEHMLLLDVTPLSLGIETWGGAFDILIPRNTTLPTSASETFTTQVDGQKHIKIHVLQGERELAADNRSLGELVLSNLPPMKAGDVRIQVTFSLDVNGLLEVSVQELQTGQSITSTLEPSSGLSQEDVENIIQESYQHAEQDLEQRILLDRRNDAERVLKAVGRALEISGAELEQSEHDAIREAQKNLEKALDTNQAQTIKQTLEALNQVTEKLAELQMNQILKVKVQGKKLEEITREGIV